VIFLAFSFRALRLKDVRMLSFLKQVFLQGFLLMVIVLAGTMQPAALSFKSAQAPGLRCGTPYGWCWATVPGKPGDPCYCPGPNGQQIPGTLF
jgi:hypothetical protein